MKKELNTDDQREIFRLKWENRKDGDIFLVWSEEFKISSKRLDLVLEDNFLVSVQDIDLLFSAKCLDAYQILETKEEVYATLREEKDLYLDVLSDGRYMISIHEKCLKRFDDFLSARAYYEIQLAKRS